MTKDTNTRVTTTTSHFMQTTPRPNEIMVRGAGSYLWGQSGRKYLDFVQGWAVNLLGHSPPEIVRALERQARTLIAPSPAYYNAPALELAERLTERTGLDHAYFGMTGADANEAAIKLVRKWGREHKRGAFEIITTHGGFHGRTLATMSATGKPGFDELFPPPMPGFRKVAYGDAAAAERAINSDTAAILVEPVQGEAGVIVPMREYLHSLRALADRHDLLLVIDEIQTGMHRTGPFLAAHADATGPTVALADIVTLGKALGGGVPVSALLCGERAGSFAFGEQGGTFHNNPLSAAAALAVLDCVEAPEFVPAVAACSERLCSSLGNIATRHGATLRGRGHLWALVLATASAHAVRDACFARGLLVNAPQPDVIRLMPSLRTTGAEIDSMAELLEAALVDVIGCGE